MPTRFRAVLAATMVATAAMAVAPALASADPAAPTSAPKPCDRAWWGGSCEGWEIHVINGTSTTWLALSNVKENLSWGDDTIPPKSTGWLQSTPAVGSSPPLTNF